MPKSLDTLYIISLSILAERYRQEGLLLVTCHNQASSLVNMVTASIGATKKGTRGGPGPPPNKEQNWEIRSKMGAKSFKIGPFWGMVIHENTCCKTKFKS